MFALYLKYVLHMARHIFRKKRTLLLGITVDEPPATASAFSLSTTGIVIKHFPLPSCPFFHRKGLKATKLLEMLQFYITFC